MLNPFIDSVRIVHQVVKFSYFPVIDRNWVPDFKPMIENLAAAGFRFRSLSLAMSNIIANIAQISHSVTHDIVSLTTQFQSEPSPEVIFPPVEDEGYPGPAKVKGGDSVMLQVS